MARRSDGLSEILGHYPTGVVIVTAVAADGSPIGAVAPTFTALSLDPPVISYTAEAGTATTERLASAAYVCVNLVAADQEALCRRFLAAAECDTDPFEGLATRPTRLGAPVLDGVLGWMECRPQQILSVGDRELVLCEVTDQSAERDSLPLLRFQEGYGGFSPSSLAIARPGEFQDLAQLVSVARAEMELLGRELGAECSIVAPSGGDLVFVATASHSDSAPTRLGFHMPLIPPLGTLFVDSPKGPTSAEWMERLPDRSPATVALAREQLSRVRRRGYSISLRGGYEVEQLDTLILRYTEAGRISELVDVLARQAEGQEVIELKEDRMYDVLQLSVPVRSPSGAVLCALRLGDLPQQVPADMVHFWIRQLQEAAWAVQDQLAGIDG